MSCELLPEWVHLFLDDVETTLCLPILLSMVLCTAQFIINHAMDIGLTIYQNLIQKSDEEEDASEKEPGEDLISKIKGFFCGPSCNIDTCASKSEQNAGSSLARPCLPRPSAQEEEWDYCEEDYDEN